MSINVFVELFLRKDKREEIVPLFAKLLQQTRSRDGNEGVTILSDQDEPSSILLVEQWQSRRQYEQYNKWRAERGDLARLAELLPAPPNRRFFDYLGV